jgi:hypothetical protein
MARNGNDRCWSLVYRLPNLLEEIVRLLDLSCQQCSVDNLGMVCPRPRNRSAAVLSRISELARCN